MFRLLIVSDYLANEIKMQVEYEDSDKEELILSNEKVKFYISHEEMQRLNLTCSVTSTDGDVYDYNEMLVLAASLYDCQELDPGDIIWAKLTGLCLIFVCLFVCLFIVSSLAMRLRSIHRSAALRCVKAAAATQLGESSAHHLSNTLVNTNMSATTKLLTRQLQ